jgi:hypothetical protein
MATTIYSGISSYAEWELPTRNGIEFQEVRLYRYPYPKFGAVRKSYLNKVWDAVDAGWILWESDYPDLGGVDYPRGHGTFGVDTSNYGVLVIKHGRQQL